MATEYPIYVNGEFIKSGTELAVSNPYDGSTVGTTWLAGAGPWSAPPLPP